MVYFDWQAVVKHFLYERCYPNKGKKRPSSPPVRGVRKSIVLRIISIRGGIRWHHHIPQPGHEQLLESALVVVPPCKTTTSLAALQGHVTVKRCSDMLE